MPTPSDIFATPTPTPDEAALASAVSTADELIRLVRYQIDGISVRSRLVGWAAIAAAPGNGPTVANVARAYYDAIAQVLPAVAPGATVPPLYELVPPFAGDAADVARAVADVLACSRAIYSAIGSAIQRWSDLSAPLGWAAIQASGDTARVDALIAAITAMWPGMSSVPMPTIHADPVPIDTGASA